MKVCLYLLAVGVFVGVASVVDGRSEKLHGDEISKAEAKKETNESKRDSRRVAYEADQDGKIGKCLDGCKNHVPKQDFCIKSKDGKMMTVQSICHYDCYQNYKGYSYEYQGKCKDSLKSPFGKCIDGCKSLNEPKQDFCIKSKDGNMYRVQSRCHYDCYQNHKGNSYQYQGECKESPESPFVECIDGCKNYEPKQDFCIKSKDGNMYRVQSICHYNCYQNHKGNSYQYQGKCKESPESLFGKCIDGCKNYKPKQDFCIKSKDGNMYRVQSKCHYTCYQNHKGNSYQYQGKCK